MQDWLSARAQATPHREALIFEDQPLTFAMLNHQVTRMSQKWRAAGILPGQRVGLIAFSHPLVVVQVFAAMRCGAVLVPLNLRLSVQEMAAQMQQSRVDWLLPYGDANTLRDLRNMGQKLAVLDGKKPKSKTRESFANRAVVLDDPLAIIHTSGTSGRPKGAVLTYGNFFYSAMASAYRLGTLPDDRWLCVLPLYHVGGLSILMRAVLYGITVDLLPRFELETVSRALETQPITLISLVPTMLYRLLENGTRWPETLRLILLGGAAASPDLLARCREAGLPVATTYGLTEAASQVATMLPGDVARKPGSVGRPLLFTEARIVGANGKPLRSGEHGEIVVRGPTVMQGYDDDPEATTTAMPDGWLHTGDIGYVDEEGDLFVVQRRSDLIVSGGENVYPAEVEQALREHPAVADVCVVGVEDAEWGQQVAAAVVRRPDAALNEADLTVFCRDRLAGYKVPRRVLFVDALPQTASGKISRAAVKALFGAES